MSLIGAVKNNDVNKVVQLLATNKISAYETDSHGFTTLMYASYYSYKDITELLLNYDNSSEHINRQNYAGATALMHASSHGYFSGCKEIAKMLLNHDDSPEHINRQDNNGWTALMYASYNSHKDIIELLLEHNPDINILNKKDESAIDLAKTEEIKELLLNWEPNGVKKAKGV